MRTHCATDGVGPSKMKSMNQPGGETPAFGGAVIVQVVPLQENAGKIVRAPIALPCVLETAVGCISGGPETLKRKMTNLRLEKLVIWTWGLGINGC
jgi:hypothetical protein